MVKKNKKCFQFGKFSTKQKKVLTWWLPPSPYKDFDMIIADGSIRSGKTISMIDGFFTWSLSNFDGENFIIAGKSMGALKRNVIEPAQQILNAKNISYNYIRSGDANIKIGNNTYYLFGGNNEASQDVIQGLTAAGALGDEVALMPRSFVEQMTARCSVENSKIWLNCNPGNPYNFLKTEYIDQATKKQIFHLKFELEDNLNLPQKTIERFKRMYSGVFYQRYINGLWVVAEGIIYQNFDRNTMIIEQKELPSMKEYFIGIDYGHQNATTFILSGLGEDNKFYIIDEYFHSGKEEKQKSPSQYVADFLSWYEKIKKTGVKPGRVYVDPSAAGFITELWQKTKKTKEFKIHKANNDVMPGIENVSSLITENRLLTVETCKNVIKEFGTYSWDPKAMERGEDRPIKQNDHTMDAIRYIVNSRQKILSSQ